MSHIFLITVCLSLSPVSVDVKVRHASSMELAQKWYQAVYEKRCGGVIVELEEDRYTIFQYKNLPAWTSVPHAEFKTEAE